MKENNQNNISKTTGLESNVAAALCYSLGLITGLLFFILETDDKFVRFHALQSIIGSVVATAVPSLLAMTIIGIVLIPFWGLAVMIFWVVLILNAYQGKKYMLPFIGEIVDSQIS